MNAEMHETITEIILSNENSSASSKIVLFMIKIVSSFQSDSFFNVILM